MNSRSEVVQNPEVGGTLGFPCGEPIDKCQLRKQKWARLPSLSGAARLGRLIYLVDNETKRQRDKDHQSCLDLHTQRIRKTAS